MPTPPVNRDSIISQRTDGTRRPYSIEAEAIFRISVSTRPPFSGENPTSCISLKATTNIATRMRPRRTKGIPRFVSWAISPPATEPPCPDAGNHRHSGAHRATPETRLELAGETGRLERIHQPRLYGTGKEGEPKADQHGNDCPLPERCVDSPEQHIQQGRRRQRYRPEQVRGAAPDGVGDNPGRHLEDHHARGKEGIGGERLQV